MEQVDVYRICALTQCDDRTVRNFLAGKRMKTRAYRAVEEAVKSLGLEEFLPEVQSGTVGMQCEMCGHPSRPVSGAVLMIEGRPLHKICHEKEGGQ